MNYAAIIIAMALLPLICGAALTLYANKGKNEETAEETEKTEKTAEETAKAEAETSASVKAPVWQKGTVLVLSECALFGLWLHLGRCTFDDPIFVLSYVMLAGMSVFCITDWLDRIVPNRILFIMLLGWLVIAGFFILRDPNRMAGYLAEYITGFLFCLTSFGLCYILARGKLGAGDVKLALIMGLYLPGSYAAAAIFYGCMLSAIFCVALLLAKKITKKTAVPLVPFLYMGLIIKYIIG